MENSIFLKLKNYKLIEKIKIFCDQTEMKLLLNKTKINDVWKIFNTRGDTHFMLYLREVCLNKVQMHSNREWFIRKES